MKTILIILAVLLASAVDAVAYLNFYTPFAAIEYNDAEAVALHGSAETFNPSAPILFHDGDTLANGNYTVTTLRAYAHLGDSSLTLAQAKSRIYMIQIWAWVDTNRNGAADAGDSTTRWTNVYTAYPSSGDPALTSPVVGYQVSGNPPVPETSTWQGNLIYGDRSLFFTSGQNVLLLIRVIDTAGNSNLAPGVGQPENWEDGGIEPGVGSGVASDKYLDKDGSGRIEDDDVVSVFYPVADGGYGDAGIIPKIEQGIGFD